MAKQTNKNKGKEKKEESFKIGKATADTKINSLPLEEIINLNKGLDQAADAYEKGHAYWDPELRKQLGSLYYNKDNHFAEKGADVVKDHFNHLYTRANKRLSDLVEPIVDDLIDNLDEKQLMSYLYGLPPSNKAKKNFKDIAKAHEEFLNLAALGQDPSKIKRYLEQYYKDDSLIQYSLGGNVEMVKQIYESTLEAKEQELNSAFTKIKDKDGKKVAELDKDFLREYVRECIKGVDEKIRPQIYKNLAYDIIDAKKEKK